MNRFFWFIIRTFPFLIPFIVFAKPVAGLVLEFFPIPEAPMEARF
jgi:hypothetical protein